MRSAGYIKPVEVLGRERLRLVEGIEIEKGMADKESRASGFQVFINRVPEGIVFCGLCDGRPTRVELPYEKGLEQFKRHVRSDQLRDPEIPHSTRPILKRRFRFGSARKPSSNRSRLRRCPRTAG